MTDDPLQWAWHLLLPWIAAALPFAGAYAKVVRVSLLEAIELDHVRTARAKGLSERRVLRRHVLRNGLIPSVNIWGLDFSHAFGGYVLYVEVIFGLPGVGLLTWTTLIGLDLPPIVALAIYLSIVVVLASALVDIAVAYLAHASGARASGRPGRTPPGITLLCAKPDGGDARLTRRVLGASLRRSSSRRRSQRG